MFGWMKTGESRHMWQDQKILKGFELSSHTLTFLSVSSCPWRYRCSFFSRETPLIWGLCAFQRKVRVLSEPFISHIPSVCNMQYAKVQYFGVVCVTNEPCLNHFLILECAPGPEVSGFYTASTLMFPYQVGYVMCARPAFSLHSDLKWQLYPATFPGCPDYIRMPSSGPGTGGFHPEPLNLSRYS